MLPQLTYFPSIELDSCTLSAYRPLIISAQVRLTTLVALPPITGPTLYAGIALMLGQRPKCTWAGSDALGDSPVMRTDTVILFPIAVIVADPFWPEPFSSCI